MRFLPLFAVSLIYLGEPIADAFPINTCDEQEQCIFFTASPADPGTCTDDPSTSSCQVEVCMMLDYGSPRCRKHVVESVDSTCVKDSSACPVPSGFGSAVEESDLITNFRQCQTGRAGTELEFLLKDGRGCSSSSLTSVVTNGLVASCQPRQEGTTSCLDSSSVGDECIWSVTVPDKCNRDTPDADNSEFDDIIGTAQPSPGVSPPASGINPKDDCDCKCKCEGEVVTKPVKKCGDRGKCAYLSTRNADRRELTTTGCLCSCKCNGRRMVSFTFLE